MPHVVNKNSVRMVRAPLGVDVGCHFQSTWSKGSPKAPLGGRVGWQFPAVTGISIVLLVK